MSRRPPSAPPVIPGFDHVKLLGSGGFADVFLYQQQLPRRQVAVKVLLTDRLGAETVAGFTAEANLMAQLATHPSIVSVYQAGVSDDGRPYLVMEYCSRPNLQVRHRRERFSEAETLRIGVQIAGAVETAHRAGILHRDIKPANILVTDYGRPALTDFGISATSAGEMAGMSVPWSPPEAFRHPPEGDASSDVYSLAATLYTLLTNRSPFEVTGASNTEIDVIARIQASPLPAIARPDVSPSLEAVLTRAMAKSPADRYGSATEFARALQRVQIELGMQATGFDVMEDELPEDVDDDGEERTRFRGITNIDAQGGAAASSAPLAFVPSFAPPPSPTGRPGPIEDATVMRPAADATVLRPTPGGLPSLAPPAAPAVADTVVRPVAGDEPPAPPRSRRGRVVGWIVAAVVVVVAGAVVAAVVLNGGKGDPIVKPSDAEPADPIIDDSYPAGVTDLVGAVSGDSAVFTWTNPDPRDGDVFQWRPVVVGTDTDWSSSEEATAIVPLDSRGTACIEVVVARTNGHADDGVEACAP